ncbi:cytochrome b561 domain-containing protein At4g18260-like isoform X1 [Durio zibethinus]|uniref:Cytochrome b561 domain-containing protein At4g18260-like isoform X1 n=1 Tax=Durio zibethinus TaxID=66656 RepID=A0A6P6BJP6_DURZI|nr:cytochrome b561 domain-containing protein At4g18260-like isoform X1 [Durio zibethinus]
MQVSHLLGSFTIPALYYVFLLPLVSCSSHWEFTASSNHKSIKENVHKLSPQMTSYITVHGLLLWVSMGFLMPVGILTIRMANKEEGGRRVKVFFYLHAILQIDADHNSYLVAKKRSERAACLFCFTNIILAVLLATIGAVMSIKNFENSFSNSHQRLGLALYGAIWMQTLIGFFRPRRGNKRRSTWYLTHWILGTVTSLVGIINIYTGLKAYHKKTSRSVGVWTILFTAEVSLIAFFYLFQDKWEYIQKQGLILGTNPHQPTPPSDQENVLIAQRDNQKVLLPEPCGKRNALRNLFD